MQTLKIGPYFPQGCSRYIIPSLLETLRSVNPVEADLIEGQLLRDILIYDRPVDAAVEGLADELIADIQHFCPEGTVFRVEDGAYGVWSAHSGDGQTDD